MPKFATPEQVNAVYVGCASLEDLAEEVADARIELAALRKDSERLRWLHRAGPNDATGCEWGIFRVLWDGNGQPVAVSQTLSDFSDLDTEMQRNP